jgi:hypothetical protein
MAAYNYLWLRFQGIWCPHTNALYIYIYSNKFLKGTCNLIPAHLKLCQNVCFYIYKGSLWLSLLMKGCGTALFTALLFSVDNWPCQSAQFHPRSFQSTCGNKGEYLLNSLGTCVCLSVCVSLPAAPAPSPYMYDRGLCQVSCNLQRPSCHHTLSLPALDISQCWLCLFVYLLIYLFIHYLLSTRDLN